MFLEVQNVVPWGVQKHQKVVIETNPLPNPMGHCKTAQTRNQEKPCFYHFLGKSRKTLFLSLFWVFTARVKSVKTDRV